MLRNVYGDPRHPDSWHGDATIAGQRYRTSPGSASAEDAARALDKLLSAAGQPHRNTEPDGVMLLPDIAARLQAHLQASCHAAFVTLQYYQLRASYVQRAQRVSASNTQAGAEQPARKPAPAYALCAACSVCCAAHRGLSD